MKQWQGGCVPLALRGHLQGLRSLLSLLLPLRSPHFPESTRGGGLNPWSPNHFPSFCSQRPSTSNVLPLPGLSIQTRLQSAHPPGHALLRLPLSGSLPLLLLWVSAPTLAPLRFFQLKRTPLLGPFSPAAAESCFLPGWGPREGKDGLSLQTGAS